MTADGAYLSGKFARQTNGVARDTLTRGLAKWKTVAADRGYDPKPVPTDSLALYGGEPLQKGGLKLEVAYRDFPRGEEERPGDWRFNNPYNLGWYDLTPSEAKHFVTSSRDQQALPDSVFRKLACKALKDAVRGQMRDWKPNELKKGALYTQLVSTKGAVKTFRLSGEVDFALGDLTFKPKLHGTASYDSSKGEFTDFPPHCRRPAHRKSRCQRSGDRSRSGPDRCRIQALPSVGFAREIHRTTRPGRPEESNPPENSLIAWPGRPPMTKDWTAIFRPSEAHGMPRLWRIND